MPHRQITTVLVAALLAGGAGFLLASARREAAAPQLAPASAGPESSSPTSMTVSTASSARALEPAAPPAHPSALLDRARAGELGALKELELRPPRDRTVDEALALAEGHAALARNDAARLLADLERDPKLFEDRATMGYAYRLALDPEVAPTLLAGLAALTHPTAADLLYDLVARGEPGARLVLLAEDLLLGPAVRGETSKPLALLLEVRAVRTCPEILAFVPRIAELGDERLGPLLERFRSRKGCGPKNQDDCWVCLRDESSERAFDEAAKAAADRAFSAPWSTAAQRAK